MRVLEHLGAVAGKDVPAEERSFGGEGHPHQRRSRSPQVPQEAPERGDGSDGQFHGGPLGHMPGHAQQLHRYGRPVH